MRKPLKYAFIGAVAMLQAGLCLALGAFEAYNAEGLPGTVTLEPELRSLQKVLELPVARPLMNIDLLTNTLGGLWWAGCLLLNGLLWGFALYYLIYGVYQLGRSEFLRRSEVQ